jgi:uncharacterized membrane protein HdeD (DUF308 family)
MNASSSSVPAHAQGKIWFYISGALSLLVGFIAIARPGLASLALTQVIGVFCVVSGVFLLGSALFGKTTKHRLWDLFSAALRIVVGVLFLVNVIKGLLALTLVLAALFLAEGVAGIFLAVKLKGKNPAWIWILLNSLAALVLGGMLLAKFPSDAAWAIGLLFGINSIFLGVSLIMYGAGLHRAEEA